MTLYNNSTKLGDKVLSKIGGISEISYLMIMFLGLLYNKKFSLDKSFAKPRYKFSSLR